MRKLPLPPEPPRDAKSKAMSFRCRTRPSSPLSPRSPDRSTRQTLFKNSWNRAEHGDANDTRDTIAKIAQLRAQKGKLLGYPNFAAWKIEDQMAKTPEAALKFMDAIVPAATARPLRSQRHSGVIDQQKGGFTLQPWDWEIYSEQVRKAKYDLDEEQVKPYFEMNNVLENGVFYAANQLYGITFKERQTSRCTTPTCACSRSSTLTAARSPCSTCDYFKRDNKQGGAWMGNYVEQSKLMGTKPVVVNVCNFSKPAPGEPALLTSDDVRTMFHEFGHALHGMFANTEYPSLSGTSTARDFVEFPSQFNEHWSEYPTVFQHYAKHYKTGAPMPAELVEKIKKVADLQQGIRHHRAAGRRRTRHAVARAASYRAVAEAGRVRERQRLKKTHLLISYVPPRYRSSYFSHIWGSGYSAGYYAYLWTQMLADDAYQWFVEHGGLTRANGDRFRQMVLSRGNTEDLETLYENWRGAKPSIEPMLKYRGLETPSAK